MVCKKCGYKDNKETKIFGITLCMVCSNFAPEKESDFKEYANDKVDWKTLETFRKYGQTKGQKQKKAMSKKASLGAPVTRAPLGYDILNGGLVPNEDASKVHSLFKTFLSRKYTLSSIAKNYGLSTNGLKKILANRTYLGEIKFDGKIYRGFHKGIIDPVIFYAVQRKLKTYLRPRKKIP